MGEVNATKFTHLNGESAVLKETNSIFLVNDEGVVEMEYFGGVSQSFNVFCKREDENEA